MCFSNILLVKTNYLVYPLVENWSKWIKSKYSDRKLLEMRLYTEEYLEPSQTTKVEYQKNPSYLFDMVVKTILLYTVKIKGFK